MNPSDYQSAGKGVIFEHYLMNDAGARFPEFDPEPVGSGFQKIVNLAIICERPL
jgi:hypothetical protein